MSMPLKNKKKRIWRKTSIPLWKPINRSRQIESSSKRFRQQKENPFFDSLQKNHKLTKWVAYKAQQPLLLYEYIIFAGSEQSNKLNSLHIDFLGYQDTKDRPSDWYEVVFTYRVGVYTIFVIKTAHNPIIPIRKRNNKNRLPQL